MAYGALRRRFGVLRSSDHFWTYSDQIHADHDKRHGITAGLFDYNRLEGLCIVRGAPTTTAPPAPCGTPAAATA
jgi:hypothetical protein